MLYPVYTILLPTIPFCPTPFTLLHPFTPFYLLLQALKPRRVRPNLEKTQGNNTLLLTFASFETTARPAKPRQNTTKHKDNARTGQRQLAKTRKARGTHRKHKEISKSTAGGREERKQQKTTKNNTRTTEEQTVNAEEETEKQHNNKTTENNSLLRNLMTKHFLKT